jgi:hypothetical protein
MNAIERARRHGSSFNERELIPVCDCEHKTWGHTTEKRKVGIGMKAQTMDEKRGIWMIMRPISIAKTWMKFHCVLP